MSPPTTAIRDAFLRRFVAQRERPVSAEPVDFAALSTHHRCLLVTDGTVTSLLEALALEPTRTRCLEQAHHALSGVERRWLEAGSGEAVIARRVVVEGADTKKAYLGALSLVLPHRLPAKFIASLQEPEASIGTALNRNGIEHRRELLWYDRRAGAVVSRTYRIFVQGTPALLISEDFLE